MPFIAAARPGSAEERADELLRDLEGTLGNENDGLQYSAVSCDRFLFPQTRRQHRIH